MLTPQEVSQHAFAKANFGGYNMAMVDSFLDTLTEDYTALYKENAVLKSKMKVLLDKVEEYRATEDGMRKALLAAQKTADQMVAEAEAKTSELLHAAESEAHARVDGLRHELESEQFRLSSAQQVTTEYISKVRELCRKELEYLDSLGSLTVPEPTPAEKTARDIEDSLQKIMAEEGDEPPMEPAAPVEEASAVSGGSASPASEEAEESREEDTGDLYEQLLKLERKVTERREAAKKDGEETEDEAPTRRLDLEDLKFGKDFRL